MKQIIALLPSLLLVACAAAPGNQAARYAHLEQLECPKSRYPAFDKRQACRLEARKEITARNAATEGK